MRHHANMMLKKEPILATYVTSTILYHNTFESSIAFCLADKLKNEMLHQSHLHDLINNILTENPELANTIREDIISVCSKDPACENPLQVLFFKGFLALESYRIAHYLYTHNRRELALCFQSRISEVFNVDIHPGAKLGKGILIDHATGLVIGETAVVGDNCSFLHEVTLGGTGKEIGDRHPKLGNNVMVGCGVKILGNITIGNNVKIGSNSVVLRPLPDNVTAVGVTASIISKSKRITNLTEEMDQVEDIASLSSSLSRFPIVLHELEIESENAISPKKLQLIYSQISLYPPDVSSLKTISFDELYIQLLTTSTNCTVLQVVSSTIRDVLFSPNLVQDILSRPYEIDQRENYKEKHNGQLKYVCCYCVKLELKKYRHFDYESFPSARDIKFKKFLGIANGVNQCKSLFSLQSPSVFKNNRIFRRTKPKEPQLRPSKVVSTSFISTSGKESNRGMSEYDNISSNNNISHLRTSQRQLSTKNRNSTSSSLFNKNNTSSSRSNIVNGNIPGAIDDTVSEV